jgi:hypothetical protein
LGFRKDVFGGEDAAGWPILCKTGDRLRGGQLGDASQLVFLREGTRWAIGNEYEPRAAYGSHFLNFQAVEPEFRPIYAEDISPYGSAYWSILIAIGTDEVAFLRQWLEDLVSSETYRRPDHQIVPVRNHEGVLLAVAACMPPTDNNPRSCQNRFIRDGMTFSFRHEPMPKEQWIKLQQTLFERVRSFHSVRRPAS